MCFTLEDLRGRPMQTVLHARLAHGGYVWTRKSIDFPELSITIKRERRSDQEERAIFVAGERAENLPHACRLLYEARHRPFDADEPALEGADA